MPKWLTVRRQYLSRSHIHYKSKGSCSVTIDLYRLTSAIYRVFARQYLEINRANRRISRWSASIWSARSPRARTSLSVGRCGNWSRRMTGREKPSRWRAFVAWGQTVPGWRARVNTDLLACFTQRMGANSPHQHAPCMTYLDGIHGRLMTIA